MCGLSAAALLGSRWVPDNAPAEMLGRHHRVGDGVIVHAAEVPADELECWRGIHCTGVPRTVFDLGRRLPFPENVIRVDALLNATGFTVGDVRAVVDRHPGARNVRRLRRVLDYADGGAESPQETRVRLIVVRGGLPLPETQIRVGPRRVDIGWLEWRVAIEYDGAPALDGSPPARRRHRQARVPASAGVDHCARGGGAPARSAIDHRSRGGGAACERLAGRSDAEKSLVNSPPGVLCSRASSRRVQRRGSLSGRCRAGGGTPRWTRPASRGRPGPAARAWGSPRRRGRRAGRGPAGWRRPARPRP